MKQSFHNALCVYCGQRNATTDDHLFARGFFLVNERDGLPKVPACTECNGLKSKLEHYCTTVLPLAARHESAQANLSTLVPPRLAQNQRLHRILANSLDVEYRPHSSGLFVRRLSVDIDVDQVTFLVALIVRGLFWHSWKAVLGKDSIAIAEPFDQIEERIFDRVVIEGGRIQSSQAVSGKIGKGSFRFRGIRDKRNPEFSIWRIELYRGIELAGRATDPTSSYFTGLTGSEAFLESLKALVNREFPPPDLIGGL